MDIVCELRSINKSYGKVNVLKDINLKLEKGKVYGFIGRNGAGKTTTMKIITGLSNQTSGTLILEDASEKKELEKMRRNIGCIIEAPALFLDMTAKQNLKALCILYNISYIVIDEILELVGLSNEGRKQVRHFSLGMKQRLGIGMALINNPKLLVLDEPINGLDPDGIVEIRNLIKRINIERGVTVLISSHILSELYQMVDNYILINNGKIIERITHDDLNKRCQKYFLIRSGDINTIKSVIVHKLKTDNFEILEDGGVKLYEFTNDMMKVMNAFLESGIDPNTIKVSEDNLEEYFFKRIGKE